MAAQDILVGIIGEGPTDIVVIDALLKGYCSKNLDTVPLQPKPGDQGTWSKVLSYCADADFRNAFANPDLFVVIQIDADIFRSGQVSQEFLISDASNLSAPELVENIRALLIRQITQPFYEALASRILFAIAVSEIECWFLAPYNQYDKEPAKNIQNCIHRLNKGLKKAGETVFIPEKGSKKTDPYYILVRHFRRKKEIVAYSKANESLGLFLHELDRLPVADETSEAS